MHSLRKWLRHLPLLPAMYRALRVCYDRWRLRGRSIEERFTDIYERSAWGGTVSVSGPGSDPPQTAAVVAALPDLIDELGISSILDIPCGDFSWLRQVELGAVEYLGADIVKALVSSNSERYGNARRTFKRLDLLVDPLPQADLLLCRDCLVHFSDEDVLRALRQICESGARWLLTTSFPARTRNDDIATCRWRPLNLQIAPFFLPEPTRLLNEQSSENGGKFRDKSLVLWEISAVQAALRASGTKFRA